MSLTQPQVADIITYYGEMAGEGASHVFVAYMLEELATPIPTKGGGELTLTVIEYTDAHEGSPSTHFVFSFVEHPGQYWKLEGDRGAEGRSRWAPASEVYEVTPMVVPVIAYTRKGDER